MKPRDFALRELDAKRLPDWPVGALKRLRPAAPPADPRDLALADHIVAGVVKNLLLLRHLIEHYSGRSLKSVDPVVQKILAIALYQLRFLDRIPDSAAVDEAVEQTRRFGEPRASGFVNAILRKATRDESPPLPTRDQPADYARVICSHPPDLYGKLEKLLGPQDALRFCEHDQSEPPTIVRLGKGIDPAAIAADAVKVIPHDQAGMYVVTGAKRSALADWAVRGIAQVQDPTAAAVVALLRAEPGQTVLDRCCGMGTKTIQLRDAVGATGRVLAMDPAENRCDALRRLIEQRHFENVEVHVSAWIEDLRHGVPPELDRALVDAPCSNSGVLARRPEARFTQNAHSLSSLAKLQDQILADTAPLIRPGGLLVYSTCSVWPEENRQRVDAFLRQQPDFDLREEHTTLPSMDPDPTRYRDGGYVAVLHRK